MRIFCGGAKSVTGRLVSRTFNGAWALVAYGTDCHCCIAGRWLAMLASVAIMPDDALAYLLGYFLYASFLVGYYFDRKTTGGT